MLKSIGLNLLSYKNNNNNNKHDSAMTSTSDNVSCSIVVNTDTNTDEVHDKVFEYKQIYSCARYTPVQEYLKNYNTDVKKNWYGIPALCIFFKTFDPINNTSDPTTIVDNFNVDADYVDMYHAHTYLNLLTKDAIIDILKSGDQNKDSLVHAICSFMLCWSSNSFKQFQKLFPQHSSIAEILYNERNNTFVYANTQYRVCLYATANTTSKILFMRTHIKMLFKYYNSVYNTVVNGIHEMTTHFNIIDELSSELIAHFHQVHTAICEERVDNALQNLIENDNIMLTRFSSTLVNGQCVKNTYRSDCMRIITGQACCGKTTLISRLEKSGWTMKSRGDIGTFSGKSKSPASVAGLHAAMEYAFRRGDIIGDRGPIDNPLWTIIMQLCDPSTDMKRVVYIILDFISQNFNENSLRYYAEQHCIVFIDPLPSCNRARMLNRNTGGDSNRARINNYFIQAIAYYIVARICGWKVYTVPYDLAEKTYCPERYQQIAEDILERFGKPNKSNVDTRPISNVKPNPDTTIRQQKTSTPLYQQVSLLGKRKHQTNNNAATTTTTTSTSIQAIDDNIIINQYSALISNMEYAHAVGIYK